MRAPPALALATLLLAVTACSDPPTVPLEDSPLLSIEDAVHNGGNEHFFWLPPMASNPSHSGVFDGAVSPVVEICEWDGNACVPPLVAEFTTTTGPGSETVRVEPADELYIVNWHTDEFDLDPALTYRIVAQVDGRELGHADVDVVSNGGQLKNVDTQEFIPLKDGRTLPIKFRIEDGAINADPCVAAITFPDAHLEAYIRFVTGIASGPITGADVAGITGLDFLFAPGPVVSLEGLQCFTSLINMSARTGAVVDLTPLAGLTTLETLSLVSNPVSDLTPISGLTSLTFLNVAATQVSDLSPIATLTNLEGLFAFQLPGLTDVTPIAGLTQLKSLWIIGSPLNGPLTSLSSLTAMEQIRIENSGVTSLAFTQNMVNLSSVSVGGNQISDLTPLSGKPITALSAPGNQLSDLTPLNSLTGITFLQIRSNPAITDISPIGSLTNLTALNMDQTNVAGQESIIAGLTTLTSLLLNNAGLTDLTFTSSLVNLGTLTVSSNSISDASPLLGLSALTTLSITFNPVQCGDPILQQLVTNGVAVFANLPAGGQGFC